MNRLLGLDLPCKFGQNPRIKSVKLPTKHSRYICSTHICQKWEKPVWFGCRIISKGHVVFAGQSGSPASGKRIPTAASESCYRGLHQSKELTPLAIVSSVEVLFIPTFRIIYHPEQDPTENLFSQSHLQKSMAKLGRNLVRNRIRLEDFLWQLSKNLMAPNACRLKLMWWCWQGLWNFLDFFYHFLPGQCIALVTFLLAYLFLSHVEYFAQIQGQISAIPGAPGVTELVIAPLLNNGGFGVVIDCPFPPPCGFLLTNIT